MGVEAEWGWALKKRGLFACIFVGVAFSLWRTLAKGNP